MIEYPTFRKLSHDLSTIVEISSISPHYRSQICFVSVGKKRRVVADLRRYSGRRGHLQLRIYGDKPVPVSRTNLKLRFISPHRGYAESRELT